ncbi:rCG64401 [Rattus norvegicus]|uniref:RCG64401 n=1 Tax=Rattus norvegicus TaxID=10116 RepID=A6HWV4_RAT|nr:rCG64401 [Rattus norvegicus]
MASLQLKSCMGVTLKTKPAMMYQFHFSSHLYLRIQGAELLWLVRGKRSSSRPPSTATTPI